MREPLLERTGAVRSPGVLVRMKAPLKRAQSRRFANFLMLFQFDDTLWPAMLQESFGWR
jgi:hypothetical protein